VKKIIPILLRDGQIEFEGFVKIVNDTLQQSSLAVVTWMTILLEEVELLRCISNAATREFTCLSVMRMKIDVL
jgi:hypothetical protein